MKPVTHCGPKYQKHENNIKKKSSMRTDVSNAIRRKRFSGGGISDRISAKHRLKKSGAQRTAVPYGGPCRTWPVRSPDSAPGEF